MHGGRYRNITYSYIKEGFLAVAVAAGASKESDPVRDGMAMLCTLE
jgi:hypothetical protein